MIYKFRQFFCVPSHCLFCLQFRSIMEFKFPPKYARPNSLNPSTSVLNYLSHRQLYGKTCASTFLGERLDYANTLYSKNLLGHTLCINALSFSNGGKYLASGEDRHQIQYIELNSGCPLVSVNIAATKNVSDQICYNLDMLCMLIMLMLTQLFKNHTNLNKLVILRISYYDNHLLNSDDASISNDCI